MALDECLGISEARSVVIERAVSIAQKISPAGGLLTLKTRFEDRELLLAAYALGWMNGHKVAANEYMHELEGALMVAMHTLRGMWRGELK